MVSVERAAGRFTSAGETIKFSPSKRSACPGARVVNVLEPAKGMLFRLYARSPPATPSLLSRLSSSGHSVPKGYRCNATKKRRWSGYGGSHKPSDDCASCRVVQGDWGSQCLGVSLCVVRQCTPQPYDYDIL